MNSQKPATSEWLTRLNELTKTKSSGAFTANDKLGKPVVLEWQNLTMLSPGFSSTMKSICDIDCTAYTPVEVQFLKTFSDPKVHEDYCAPLDELFKNSSPQDQAEWQAFIQMRLHRERSLHGGLQKIATRFKSRFLNKIQHTGCFLSTK